MMQSREFLGILLGPLLKIGLPLIKNVIKLLAKSVLIPLGLTAAASAADAGIHKKNLGSCCRHSSSLFLRPPLNDVLHNTTLIISNDEMKDITDRVKSLEDFDLLLKRVREKESVKWLILH